MLSSLGGSRHTHFREGRASALIPSPPAWEICLFFPTCLFVQPFIYVRMGSWAFTLFSGYNPVSLYLFFAHMVPAPATGGSCSRPLRPLDMPARALLSSSPPLTTHTLTFRTARCSTLIVRVPFPRPRISPFSRSPGSFHRRVRLEANTWYQVCSLPLVSLLLDPPSCQGRKHVCTY